MRTLIAIAGLSAGLVFWTAPAMAHGRQHAVADKPIVTAEKGVPTGPRICLFSQNGNRAEPAPGAADAGEVDPPRDNPDQPVGDDAHRVAATPAKLEVAQSQPQDEAKADAPQQPTRQGADRVCDRDVAAPVPPHG